MATGVYQMQVFAPSNLVETRWGSILVVKMIAFVVLMILLMIHTMYFSKKIRILSDEVINGDEDKVGDLDYLRRQSWLFSFLMLLVTTATLWLGIALGNHQFSLS
jgi:putative copper export protein